MHNKQVRNNKIPQWLQRATYGILMGTSDLVPGYSGGTTLTLLAFYDPLVANAKGVFKPIGSTKRWNHFVWILPFIITWAIAFIGLSFVVKQIKDVHYEDFLVVLFGAFAFCCIPLYMLVNKPKIIASKNWKIIMVFLIGFLLIISVGLIIFLLKFNEPIDITQVTKNNQIITFFQNNPQQAVLFFLAALFAGFFMIIPGISGSMVTYLFNQYWTINFLVTDSISNLFSNLNIVFLILFVLVALIGLVISIWFSNWMLKNYRDLFYAFAFGMVCSSFIAIFLVAPRSIWTAWAIGSENIHISLIVLAIIIAIALNGLFVYWYKKKHQLKWSMLFS